MSFIIIAVSSGIHGRQNSESSWRYTPGSSTSIGSSGSDIESSCGGFTNCTCQYSNTYGISVNCSNSGLNTTQACSICLRTDNVTSLDLSRNSLYHIPQSCFQACGKLKTLSLSYCNVQTIETGTFSCLRELTYLDLSYNMALGFITLRNVSYDLQFTKIEVLNYSKVYKTFGEPTWINTCGICFLENTTLSRAKTSENWPITPPHQ